MEERASAGLAVMGKNGQPYAGASWMWPALGWPKCRPVASIGLALHGNRPAMCWPFFFFHQHSEERSRCILARKTRKVTIRLTLEDLERLDALRLSEETRSTAAARILREALRYSTPEILKKLNQIEQLLRQHHEEVPSVEQIAPPAPVAQPNTATMHADIPPTPQQQPNPAPEQETQPAKDLGVSGLLQGFDL